MPHASVADFLDALSDSGLFEAAELNALTGELGEYFADSAALAREMVHRGKLTPYQADRLAQGYGQELVLGPYVLLDRLGEGGMGQVFKARHRLMNRIVALKVIRPDRLANAEAVARFRREIQAAARLAHPNVVLAHDAAEVGALHILVMEYVDGTDLARLVQERGPLPVAEACDYVLQALRGLQHAHESGLVHRDLKPSNLLLSRRDGIVKILDLGLARLREASGASGPVTADGAVMGTPDYMPPEQALDFHRADIRADIYSLGCTLYHLLTGRPPFPGGTHLEKILKHREIDPAPIETLRPNVPRALGTVLRRMLAKRPDERYATPTEAAAALEPFCRNASEPIRAGRPEMAPALPPVGEPERIPSTTTGRETDEVRAGVGGQGRPLATTSPHRRRIALLVGLALVLVVGGVLIPQIILRIRDSKGNQTEVEVPQGSKVRIGADGKTVDVTPPAITRQYTYVNIQAQANQKLTDDFHSDIPGNNLAELPRGEQTFAGLKFQIGDGVIQLGNKLIPDKPRKIEGIAIGKAFARLHILHATGIGGGSYAKIGKSWFVNDGARIAEYIVRYQDQTNERISVIYGKDVEDWWRPRKYIARAKVAWVGDNDATKSSSGPGHEQTIRLYLSTWENPHPDKQVVRIDYVSTEHGTASPFCVAMTLEQAEIAGLARSNSGMTPVGVAPPAAIPLSPLALVSHPARLPGVQSWTIETYAHRDYITAIAYSPNNRWLASSSRDGTIRIWDPGSGALVRVLVANPNAEQIEYFDPYRLLAWSANSRLLAYGGMDGVLQVWEAESGRLVHSYKSHSAPRFAVAWSPRGNLLAAAGRGEGVLLWDSDSRQFLNELPEQKDALCVAWSPDGNTLAVGGENKQARLWEMPSRRPLRTLKAAGPVCALTWSPDSKKLACGTDASRFGSADVWGSDALQCWESESGRLLYTAKEAGLRGLTLEWSPDGKRLIGGWPPLLWDAVSGKRLRSVPSGEVVWSPDGKTLAASMGKWVNLLDPESFEPRKTVPPTVACAIHVPWVAWSPKNRVLAAAGSDNTIRLWEPDKGRCHVLSGHRAATECVAWSPDGGRLASASSDHTVRIWDAQSRKPVGLLEGPTHPVMAVAWSSDGKILAAGDRGGKLWLWPIATPTFSRDIAAQTNYFVDLAWSPRGSLLATLDQSTGTVRLWNPETGKVLQKFDNTVILYHGGSVVWSSDGKTLFSHGPSRTARFRDALTGTDLKSLSIPDLHLACSPDEKMLASGTWNLVRFWSADTSRMLCARTGHTGPIFRLSWSGDGGLLASCCQGSQIRLWDTASQQCRLVLMAFPNQRALAISPDGHYRGTPGIDRLLRYVIQMDDRQETLTAEEFAKRFGWKNDPERVGVTRP